MADAPLIQFEYTPNPEAVRILPGIPLARGAAVERRSGEDTANYPVATAFLAIDGIASVLIGRDFVTAVRASPDLPWSRLKPQLLMAVADLLLSGEPLVLEQGAVDTPQIGDDEIATHIREVIDRFVRPALARDGGEATLTRYDAATGTAHVRMGGACGGCPSGKTTLKHGVEKTIMKYVPEVASVVASVSEGQFLSDPKARFRAWIGARMK